VKNQYFGDNKDLWKYDLVMTIMKAGLVSHFTFLPMLTEPDGSGHGDSANRSRASAGNDDMELVDFLDECLREGKKDINEIDVFFRRHGVSVTIYNGGSRYFTHQGRRQYFAGIGDELLSKSLVLVDPDNGLEVKRSGEKHILYGEVKALYDRMDEGSILMVYQYFPRVPRQQYLNTRMEELREKVSGDYPVCISDNEVAFFFLTKDGSLEHALIHLISDYSGRYSN